MDHRNDIGRQAAARALETAKRCAAVAGLAVVLSPLAALPAVAAPQTAYSLSVDGTSITYRVYNEPDNTCNSGGILCAITGISLPEYHRGDLDFSAPGALPDGWFVNVNTSAPTYPGAAVSEGTAFDFVNLSYDTASSGEPIYSDETEYFTAKIPAVDLIDADFGYQYGFGFTITAEPPIPNTQAAVTPPSGVPEPSMLATLGIGLAALGALRRRRKS